MVGSLFPMPIRPIWVLLILQFVACGTEQPPGIPQKSANLGGDIRSGMSWTTVHRETSVAICKWIPGEVKAKNPAPVTDPNLIARVQFVANSDKCSHLGNQGKMKLEFINDRLMEVEFIPNDFVSYRSSMEKELTRQNAIREEPRLDERPLVLEDGTRLPPDESFSLPERAGVRVISRGDTKIVYWRDMDLTAWAISL